jgi:predicted DNA-binding transcriptional regulator AlpA
MSEILTLDELAAWLRLSKRAIYEMTSARGRARMEENPLPTLRINGAIRFCREDVQSWLDREREKVAA